MAARKKKSKKRVSKKSSSSKTSGRGAEEPPARRDCGTMRNHERLMRTVPGYIEARDRCEQHAWRSAMSPLAARSGCTRIPVVVHVVWRTATENISQDQIDSQIKVLNEDFRLKNADASTIPSVFAPLAEDARIEFELASVDPDGNPTDGVTRTKTTVAGFMDDDKVKSSASGGADAWPSDKYLNIWVCKLAGGLLGYAQFPGGPAATDGVVVTHTGFGTTGTASAPFNLGRTTTHEVGHWLNLFHIWGDDGSGCFGSDHVADTPNQAGSNTGVPTFPKVSCGNAPNGDMFMNYMDYTDDRGMTMFTRGQVARMQSTLDGPRSSIGTTVPCEVVGPKTPPKELPKDLPKDQPKDFLKDLPKDIIKELIKELPKDLPKDPPKEFPKDLPKDPPKDFTKDSPFDPGPKSYDPGPKSFDPGPYGAPWSAFAGRGPMPFVLATGASGSGSGGCEELARQNAALQAAYQELQARYQALSSQYQALAARGGSY